MALDLGTLVAYLDADDSGLQSGLRDAQGDLRSAGSRMTREGAGIGHRMGSRISAGLKKTVKAGFAALAKIAKAGGIAAAAAVGTLGVAGIKSAAGLQKAQATLTGLYGSAKQAKSTMDALQKVSEKSSIDTASYDKAAASLAYAGVKGKKAVQVLDHVGKAIVGAGGGSEDLQGASDALLSMVNAGKVQLDTLQQMSNANVPILSGLAAHFHTSIDNVNEMASKGKIKLDDVLEVMQKGTGKTWKKQEASAKQVEKTLAATWSRMKDKAITTLGTALVPVLAKLTPIIEKLGNSFGKWLSDVAIPAVSKLSKWVGDNLWPAFQKFSSGVSSSLMPVLKSLWATFEKNLLPALEELGDTIVHTVLPAAQSIWQTFTRNVLPVLQSIWKTIIGKVYPAIVSIGTAIIKNVLPFLAKMWKAFAEDVMPSLQHLWDVISTKILPILIALAKFIATKVIPVLLKIAGPILKVVFKALGKLIDIVADIIGWLADHLVPAVRNAFTFLSDKAKWLWHKGIQPAFHGIKKAAQAVSDKFWTVMHGIRDAFKWVKDKVLGAVRWIVDKFLWLAEKIIDAAAKAFGWVPGLGGKLKSASKHFKSFREKVNRELGQIKDRKVKLDLHTPGLSAAAGMLGGGGGRKLTMVNAAGGTIPGQRAPYGDKVLSWLAPGEEVISNRHGQADKHRPLLKAINSGQYQGHADGGTVFNVATSGLDTSAAKFRDLRVSMNKFTQRVVSKLTKKAQAALDVGASIGNVGGGVKRWTPLVLRALRMLGQPASLVGPVLHRMMQESGGNPRAINLWDSNARIGQASRGLMQTIPATFAAYAGRFRSLGIYNPFANIYAGLNYAIHRYPSLRYAMLKSGGYAHGTTSARRGWHKVGEQGPEWIYSPNGGETVLQNGKKPPSGPHIDTVNLYAPSDKGNDFMRELSYGLHRLSLPGAYGGVR